MALYSVVAPDLLSCFKLDDMFTFCNFSKGAFYLNVEKLIEQLLWLIGVNPLAVLWES